MTQHTIFFPVMFAIMSTIMMIICIVVAIQQKGKLEGDDITGVILTACFFVGSYSILAVHYFG